MSSPRERSRALSTLRERSVAGGSSFFLAGASVWCILMAGACFVIECPASSLRFQLAGEIVSLEEVTLKFV